MYEYELLNAFEKEVCHEFKNDFNDDFIILREVKISSKIADIVITNKEISKIYAIELKVKNWKDAFRQAMNYQLWAKKSYIALPKDNIKMPLKQTELFLEYGVGLISIDGVCIIEIEARESDYLNETYVKAAIKEINIQLNGECVNDI